MLSPILELLIRFFKVGLFSIGGGYATIPLIQDQIVKECNWLTIQEFTDIITISQMTPGPLAVNVSTFVGVRIFGISGAIVATLGCCISGFTISLLLYQFFKSKQETPSVQYVLKALKAVCVGLIASSAATLLTMAFFETKFFNFQALILCILCFMLLRKKNMNPLLVLMISGCAGIFLY